MITYNLQEYDFINEKISHNYFGSFIIIFLIIGIVVIISKFNFYIYEKNVLIYEDNNYSLVIDATKIDDLDKNIYINKKKYTFKIKDISNYQNINGTIYAVVNIDLDYKSKSKVIECYFLKDKNTILNMLVKFIQGG